ncbi:MAG: YybH family protein, partial [Thermoanaerobaculia bacterium]
MKPSALLFLLISVVTAAQPAARAQESPRTPIETAAAYLTAMEASDLEAAGALFAADSLIFETGGVEGTWSAYRDHHIGPELDAIKSFVISHRPPAEQASADGTMAFVAWPIEYTIELADGRVIESRGTVTFVLENHGHHFLIK